MEKSPNHATKSIIYLVRKVEGLLCKNKKKFAEQSGRIGSVRTARPKEEPPGRAAGPDQSVGPNRPNFWAWAGPAKKTELGRGPLTKGGRDRGAAVATASGRRFSPLDAAMKAEMDAGDSSGHRRHYAVIDRDLTGAQSVGIGGKSHENVINWKNDDFAPFEPMDRNGVLTERL
ncbi:hypothetical protein CRG98_011132 [Punica granatum]|uniref:Uncharacterized protein n=1 Tax=Punica granatum TaxID=22663 RepID=A0A2I0KJ01_PUNGR|nr:hypothetical protein CRG98_011132 [Punica granatum]